MAGKIITPQDEVKNKVLTILANLANYFGPAFKLTLVARHMTDDKAILIMSEDISYEKVIEALQRAIKLKQAPAHKLIMPETGKQDG